MKNLLKPYKQTLLLLLISVGMTPVTMAETPEEKGLAIAIEIDKRDSGFQDLTSQMKMVLKNRNGETSEREMKLKTLEVQGDGDKSLTIFQTPKDVKGTAFLSFTHVARADDQWLYLPALKRVKRISSRNKSGPFMGSEFAFEDLSSQEVEKYSYKYLKDEILNENNCFVVERIPTDKNSGYTKSIVWVDMEKYIPQKIDFYDRKGALSKTLSFFEYNQYLDKFWRASKMEMVNHITGKSTILTWENYEFKTGLKESDFNQNRLKSIR